jgi:hypothetical protein
VLALASAGAAAAQDATIVTPYLHDTTRVESWSFFEPRPGGGDPTYTLLGNRATLGVRVRGVRFDVDGAFEYGQLVGLPRNATGPGPLGPGALYFQSARATRAYQLYFRTLSVRAKNVLPGVSIDVGRMRHASSATRPGDADDVLRRTRVEGRLIGEFESSMFRRAFDGVRVDAGRSRWRAAAALLFPTQGGYEESANASLSAVKIWSAEAALSLRRVAGADDAAPSIQVFAYRYADRREITLRPDNVGGSVAAADISIGTFGGAHWARYRLGPGWLDTVVWAAAQGGRWYGQRHRAFSGDAELGYRLPLAWQPWLRVGVLYATGDADPRDGTHQTFFPMVPSANRHVRSMTYAPMNVRDLFAQLQINPKRLLQVDAEVHHVSLARSADRWYAGSGATARTGTFFGYVTRPSTGVTALGVIVEGAVTLEVTPRWSLRGYAGVMNGSDLVRRSFAGTRLRVVSFESVLRFE